MGLKSKIGNKLRPVAECTYVRTYIHVRKLATTMRSVDHGGITMNGTQLTLTGRNGLKERGNNFHSVTTRFALKKKGGVISLLHVTLLFRVLVSAPYVETSPPFSHPS